MTCPRYCQTPVDIKASAERQGQSTAGRAAGAAQRECAATGDLTRVARSGGRHVRRPHMPAAQQAEVATTVAFTEGPTVDREGNLYFF
jgi:hypothetical protein